MEYIFSFEQDPIYGRWIFLGLLALVSIVVWIWDGKKSEKGMGSHNMDCLYCCISTDDLLHTFGIGERIMTKEELEKLIHGYAMAMYKMGLEDGMKEKPSLIYEQYEKGLNDAWECAKKAVDLWKRNEEGFIDVFKELFGSFSITDLFKYTPQEAIAKIKEYEKKQEEPDDEIFVGDEVMVISKAGETRGVVVRSEFSNGEDWYSVLGANEGWTIRTVKNNLRKTGYHFSEIELVMHHMREHIKEDKE